MAAVHRFTAKYNFVSDTPSDGIHHRLLMPRKTCTEDRCRRLSRQTARHFSNVGFGKCLL